jgi:hypothetical protein
VVKKWIKSLLPIGWTEMRKEYSGFPDIAEREKEIDDVIDNRSMVYQAAFIHGLEFAAKIAERQRYGVAESLRKYIQEIYKCV